MSNDSGFVFQHIFDFCQIQYSPFIRGFNGFQLVYNTSLS